MFTDVVINPVLIVYIIRTLTSESVLKAGFAELSFCEEGSETDLRNPVRLLASKIHKDVAIIASATTALPKAKYRKY